MKIKESFSDGSVCDANGYECGLVRMRCRRIKVIFWT